MEALDSETQSLLQQLSSHQQNLNHLNVQAAKFGRMHEPTWLNSQIQDTRKDIERLKSQLLERGLSETAISHYLALLDRGEPMTVRQRTSPLRQRPSTVIALVALVVAIAGTIWWATRSGAPLAQYSGTVRDLTTSKPLAHAKITLELGGNTQVLYTDSEGLYRFNLAAGAFPRQGVTTVDLEGYEAYRRNIVLLEEQLQLEDIRLVKIQAESTDLTPNPTLTPSPPPTNSPAPSPSDALAINARLRCNFSTKCYQLRPEGWEPAIPEVALGSQGLSDQDFEQLVAQYGAKTFLFFPFGTPIPRDVAPEPENPVAQYACIPGSSVYIEVSLHNTGTRQIIIERDPMMKLLSLEDFPGPVHAFLYEPEGGVLLREYAATIKSIPLGDHISVVPAEKTRELAAYTLQPDEIEIFHIYLDCAMPGKYQAQIGIKLQNAQDIIWDFDGVLINSPEQYYNWVFGIEKSGYVGALNGLTRYNRQSGTWDNIERLTVDQWIR